MKKTFWKILSHPALQLILHHSEMWAWMSLSGVAASNQVKGKTLFWVQSPPCDPICSNCSLRSVSLELSPSGASLVKEVACYHSYNNMHFLFSQSAQRKKGLSARADLYSCRMTSALKRQRFSRKLEDVFHPFICISFHSELPLTLWKLGRRACYFGMCNAALISLW